MFYQLLIQRTSDTTKTFYNGRPIFIYSPFQFISHAQAIDGDSGQNAQLIYTITNSTSDFTRFTVNTTSGVISLTQPLDYESVSSIILGITTQDLGVAVQLRRTALLTIKVLVSRTDIII